MNSMVAIAVLGLTFNSLYCFNDMIGTSINVSFCLYATFVCYAVEKCKTDMYVHEVPPKHILFDALHYKMKGGN